MRATRTAQTVAGDRVWMSGLLFAIVIAPFAGGVRGPVVYAGWMLIPLAAAWRGRTWAARFDRLSLPPTPRAAIVDVAIGGLLGLAAALMLLGLSQAYPPLLAFIRQLPLLHEDMTGGRLGVFIALIPFAHVAHELFYRGFLQRGLAARLGAQAPAVLIAGLLFAWTHVIVFQSEASRAAIETLASAGRWAGGTPQEAFISMLAFTGLESAAAGVLTARRGAIAAGVAFRAVNLTVLALALL